MSLKITIIDYDAGNLRNVQKAIEHCGYQSITSNKVQDVEEADVLILPGVGSFHDGMSALERLTLDIAIKQQVIEKKKPMLGICLGMQLLAEEGDEGGKRPGLGLLPMTIKKISSEKHGLRVPHMGWENVTAKSSSILFSKIPENADFYFAHSYYATCKPEDEPMVVATCEYGHLISSAVEKNNIFASQFHPEKSQRYGLQLLRNFVTHCEVQSK